MQKATRSRGVQRGGLCLALVLELLRTLLALLGDGVVYLYLPHGYGRSKLTGANPFHVMIQWNNGGDSLWNPTNVTTPIFRFQGTSPEHFASAARAVRETMREGARSLNLSNAVAVAVYEAWRQLAFR